MFKKIINFGTSRNYCRQLNFKIKMPEVDNLKTEHLTKKQLERLLISIDKDSNKIVAKMMKFVLFTGLRRGNYSNSNGMILTLKGD